MENFENSQWISGPAFDYGADDALYYADNRNHVLSKSFELASFDEAVLDIAVLGYAQVRLNGRLLPDAELLGDWTNYTKLVTYRAFDVSGLVCEGTNTISIELGNGWYNPSPLTLFGKYNLRARLAEVGTPAVMASLSVDGVLALATDESWECREGQLLFNNIYLGERRDLSSEGGKDLKLRAWENDRVLEPSPVEICRRFEAVEGKDLHELDDGSLLVDFHVLETGSIEFEFVAHEGDTVRLSYAEEVDASGNPSFESSYAGLVGMVVPEGFRISGGPGASEAAVQEDVIICAEGQNRFANVFSLHSCRYVLIEGLKREQIGSIAFVPIHTGLSATAKVSTGNAFYDSLVDAALRTKLNNVHGLWEDCARERLGYGGDMIALAASNFMAFDCEGLARKTVRDFRNDQTEAGGVPETAPFVGIGSNGTAYGEGPLLWQLAYPHIVLRAFQFYGCKDVVEAEWPYVKKLVDYMLSWDPAELAPHCLGDHGSVLTGESFKSGTPDKLFVGWCTIARFVRAAMRFEAILGLPDSGYGVRFEELKAEIIGRFGRADGSFGDGTQTGLAFAADLGLADEAKLAELLVKKIREQDGILATGIFGTTIAFDLLHRTGHSDVVEAWLNRDAAPSFKAMLASGNRALAEQFETHFSSFNHAMFSSYLQWFYQGLGSIRVADDAVGANKIELCPFFSVESDNVECSLMTRNGLVRTRWTRAEDGSLSFAYAVPEGVEVALNLPEFVCAEKL